MGLVEARFSKVYCSPLILCSVHLKASWGQLPYLVSLPFLILCRSFITVFHVMVFFGFEHRSQVRRFMSIASVVTEF